MLRKAGRPPGEQGFDANYWIKLTSSAAAAVKKIRHAAFHNHIFRQKTAGMKYLLGERKKPTRLNIQHMNNAD